LQWPSNNLLPAPKNPLFINRLLQQEPFFILLAPAMIFP
jgi:hypothetical protein